VQIKNSPVVLFGQLVKRWGETEGVEGEVALIAQQRQIERLFHAAHVASAFPTVPSRIVVAVAAVRFLLGLA